MYERNYKLLSNKFREFFLPTLFTSMTGNISMFIDSLIVSNLLGAATLAAIQPIAPLTTFINLIYWMIGLGGSVLCSVAKAEFDEEKSNSIFSIALTSLVSIGLLIAVICTVFSPQIIQILTQSNNNPLVGQYYSVYVLGMPFLFYIMSLSYFVRVDGFSQLPFRASLISNIVNLTMDVVLIQVFHMGLSGAALATIIGYICGCTYLSTYFINSERTLKYIKVKAKKFITLLSKISKSGFSSSSTQLYLTIKIFVINCLIILVIGNAGLTAYNICYNSLFIVYMFLIGTAQTMSPIVSVYFKEEDYSGVNYVIKKSLKIVLASSLILSTITIIYPEILLLLYHVNNPEYIPVVLNAVRIYAISYVGTAITFLYTFYAQAIQENKLSSIISALSGLIMPVSFAIIFTYLLGANGIWISVSIAELATILFIFTYSRYINKKTDDEYRGFFINKHSNVENVLEYTVKGSVDEIVGLSSKVEEYLKDYKSKTLVSLAIEEILANIFNINDNIEFIDVIVKIEKDHILISVKDPGIEFNPVIEHKTLSFDNISLLNNIADKIDYSRVLGLNSTVITINKNNTDL